MTDVKEENFTIAIKVILVVSFVLIVLNGWTMTRTEVFGKRIVTIETCVKAQEYDGLKLKADEIIGWNVKEGMSALEIYSEWESKQWVSSIAELKYCLSKEIGRSILVEHFGEDEISALEKKLEG